MADVCARHPVRQHHGRAKTSPRRYYRADEQRTRLFTAGAVLAVVIGAIGLYGLAAFNTGQRIREIGIRKTLGASTRQVLTLLVGAFLRPVLIANLIAWPLAFVAIRRWLAGFDQHVPLDLSYFVAAASLAIVIAVVTVLSQSIRVARSEPARALGASTPAMPKAFSRVCLI